MDWETIKEDVRGPVALVMPPFKDDLSLDLDALRQNIRYMADRGLRRGRGLAIVPCGTGEYLSLSKDEHRQMVETAVRATDGELPIVAGVGSCNLNDAIELARNARQAGARCVMIPPPFYDRIDAESLFTWYRTIAAAVDVGIMLYDQVWRAGLGTTIDQSLMERLATIPNVVSLKYGSPSQYYDYVAALQRFAGRFAFVDNSLGFTSTMGYMHGAAGFISGPSSWWPEYELRYWDLLQQGNYVEADRLHANLGPYMQFHRGEEFGGDSYYYGSAVIKACLEYVGLKGGPVRPPFRALTAQQKQRVWDVLALIGAKRNAASTQPVGA